MSKVTRARFTTIFTTTSQLSRWLRASSMTKFYRMTSRTKGPCLNTLGSPLSIGTMAVGKRRLKGTTSSRKRTKGSQVKKRVSTYHWSSQHRQSYLVLKEWSVTSLRGTNSVCISQWQVRKNMIILMAQSDTPSSNTTWFWSKLAHSPCGSREPASSSFRHDHLWASKMSKKHRQWTVQCAV